MNGTDSGTKNHTEHDSRSTAADGGTVVRTTHLHNTRQQYPPLHYEPTWESADHEHPDTSGSEAVDQSTRNLVFHYHAESIIPITFSTIINVFFLIIINKLLLNFLTSFLFSISQFFSSPNC